MLRRLRILREIEVILFIAVLAGFTLRIGFHVDAAIPQVVDNITDLRISTQLQMANLSNEIHIGRRRTTELLTDISGNIGGLRKGIEGQQDAVNKIIGLATTQLENMNKLVAESTEVLQGIGKSNEKLSAETIATMKVMQGTLRAATADAKQMEADLKTINERLKDPRIDHIITNLDVATAEGAATVGNFETVTERLAKPGGMVKWGVDKILNLFKFNL